MTKSQSDSLCPLKIMSKCVCCSLVQGRWGGFSPLYIQSLGVVFGVGLGPEGRATTDLLPGVSLHSSFPQSQEGLCFEVKLSIAGGRQFSGKIPALGHQGRVCKGFTPALAGESD